MLKRLICLIYFDAHVSLLDLYCRKAGVYRLSRYFVYLH